MNFNIIYIYTLAPQCNFHVTLHEYIYIYIYIFVWFGCPHVTKKVANRHQKSEIDNIVKNKSGAARINS